MKTTLFVEYSPEWCSPQERASKIREMLLSQYKPGYLVLDMLFKRNMSLAIAVGTGPLDEEFAKLIRLINLAEVPVTLWLTLSDEKGYWTNGTNLTDTYERIGEIVRWAQMYDVKFERIGIDLEWNVQIATALASGKIFTAIKLFREFKKRIDPHAQSRFENILEFLKALGIGYEFYEFPKVMKFLSFTGLTVPDGSRVIEMDYTSFYPKALASWILRKTRSADTIPAIGIVNGVDGQTPGRMLSKGLPRHLEVDDIRNAMKVLRENGEPEELYVFALNSVRGLITISHGLK